MRTTGNPMARHGAADPRESRAHALEVYLNDHLAGATGGARLAHRLASHQGDPERARELTTLASEVDRDRTTLRQLMRELGVPVHRYLLTAALVGERLARLKPNGRLLRKSEVRAVMELETMLLGVQGKAALWRLLRNLPEGRVRGRAELLDGLLTRADRQADTLERLRERAAVEVMAGAGPGREEPRPQGAVGEDRRA